MSAERTATYIQIALGAGALITMIAALLRYTARRFETFVAREITEATKPIHPDSNGGLSLADVARGVDELKNQWGWSGSPHMICIAANSRHVQCH